MKTIHSFVYIVMLAAFAGMTARANAQTFDKGYAKSLILAGNQTDATNTLTLYAPTLSPLAPIAYILPASPGTAGQVLETTGASSPYQLQWTNGIAGSVLYNQTSLQSTATIAATNYLFDVGYASTASTNQALGAQITSTNTAAGAGTAAQNSASGLIISATATGTGATTGTATGLTVNVGGAGAADTILPNIILHTAIPSGLAGWGTSGDYSEIMTADSGLILKQTGDLYGASILQLQNRNGSNGALFQTIPNAANPGVNLCDFGFKPGTGVQSNIRLEDRTGTIRNTANNTFGEFEFFMNTLSSGGTATYNFSTGEGATTIELGNFGLGMVNPTQLLQMQNGNLLLSNTSTTADQLQFQGTSSGISTFQAGAQASNYINYTLPTVTTAPTANQVLTISSISGNGALATPYVAALTWSNSGSEVFAMHTATTNITSTSLAVDPTLQLTLVANATYEFSGVIAYDGAGTGGTTASNLNIAMHFATGTLTSIRWSADQAGTAVSPSSITTDGTAITSFHVDPVTATNDQSIFISGIIVVGATGGTLEVEEALNSAAGNTEILSNSFIRATRVQ
jgi:hypothetical protein